jgi:hypothetical protein
LADLPAPDLPADPDLPVAAAELDWVLRASAFVAEPGLLGDFAVDECFVAALLAVAVLLATETRALDVARSIEKLSELEDFELEDFVPVAEVPAEEGRILSATYHQSIGPGVRGALVGLNLLTAVDGTRFLCLEALHHLTDGFGALGGALPGLHLAIPLSASADDHLCLLPQRLLEAGEKSLVVTRHGAVDAGFGADRKAADITFVIALQLGELRLAFGYTTLAERQRLGPAPLLIVNDVLNHLESLSAFH